MTFKQTNDILVREYNRFINDYDSTYNKLNILLSFRNARSNVFKYNETVRIKVFTDATDGKNGKYYIIVDEKNSKTTVFGTLTQFYTDNGIPEYKKFMKKLLSGYEKLGKATIDFYDSL